MAVDVSLTDSSPTPLPITIWGPLQERVRRGVGYRHLVLGIALILATQTLYGVGVMWYLATHVGPSDLSAAATEFLSTNVIGVLGGLLSLWIAFLITVWVGSRAEPGGFRSLTGGGVRWRTDLPVALAIALGVQLLSVLVQLAMQHLSGSSATELGNTGTVTDVQGLGKYVIAAGAVLGAPIVEELFFRGLVLTVLVRKWGTVFGVIGSSIFFGALHAQGTITNSIFTVTMTASVGAVLAVIKLRTGRIGASMVAHVVFNLAGVAGALLLPS